MAKYCSSCGKEIAEGIKFCPSCGKAVFSEIPPVQAQTVQAPSQVKNPWIAAILSLFISGTGQIYNGQVWSGIGILIVVYAFYFIGSAAIEVDIIKGSLLVLTSLILGILAIYDAYTGAQKINRGEIKV